MFYDEVTFPGGVYYEGGYEAGDRTDFSVGGIGNEKFPPLCLNLYITTGSVSMTIYSIMPNDMEKLGKWLMAVAKEKREEMKAEDFK